jgi:hypothetical protein
MVGCVEMYGSVPGFVSKIRLLFFVTQKEYSLAVAVRRSTRQVKCRLQSWRQRLHQTSRAAILESRSMPRLIDVNRVVGSNSRRTRWELEYRAEIYCGRRSRAMVVRNLPYCIARWRNHDVFWRDAQPVCLSPSTRDERRVKFSEILPLS